MAEMRWLMAAVLACGAGWSVEDPLRDQYRRVNAHDHLYMLKHLDNYLKAAEAMGVARTILVASSEFTFLGEKGDPTKLNDWSSLEVLEAAKAHPERIIPFVTLHPDDPDKVTLLKNYVAQGARGLKLFTGHGTFHDRPLQAEEMLPVYAYCEEIGLPIIWHVNLGQYYTEFAGVMLRYPKLVVVVPHFGVAFFRPDSPLWGQLGELLKTFPNIYVDSSFGTREILVEGLERVSQHTAIFRAFYEQWQDRILWGTDMVITGNAEKTAEWMESVIRACRDMHEKEAYHFWMAARGSKYASPNAFNPYGALRGLALPDPILKKIYETNIEKVLARP